MYISLRSNDGNKQVLYLFLLHCLLVLLSFNSLTPSVFSASSSVGNATLRDWLTSLKNEANSLEASSQQLQKAIEILSQVNNTASIIKMRSAQLKKINSALDLLKQEMVIISATCVNNDGPDCSIPICDSKCSNCSSSGKCASCIGNFDGFNCSSCKSGWKDPNCSIPICDSKCLNCSSPAQCSNCSGNWNGSTCSTCKSGWNGTTCSTPICDSKCLTCLSPGNCSLCAGNWQGMNCSSCKSGWSGSNCNTTTSSLSNFTPILNNAQILRFQNEILTGAQFTPQNLLYKGSVDGFAATKFHSKCDGKGRTIIIIKAKSGAIFGGFSTVSWAYDSQWVSDSTAFLFSLVSSTGEERFKKLTQENGSNYKGGKWIYYYSKGNVIGAGPTFGGGYDLQLSDNCNLNTASFTDLCKDYCDTSMTVGSATARSYLAGSYNFQVEDYEVYSF